MGLAKNKLFGEKKSKWPLLSQLVKEKILLQMDLRYAELQVPDGTEKEAAIYAALFAMARKGHLYMDKTNVYELSPQLASFIPEEKRYYLPKFSHFEEEIVKHVKRLLSYKKQQRKMDPIEGLTDEQNQAVTNALSHPFSLITGGPGTGKTHTASAIVKAFNTSTILAAPTGKAAAHLKSKMPNGIEAKTLHSLLKVSGPWSYQKEVKPLKASLVIVDECSMIEPALFARLLEAIAPETTLVLMGDIHQLPAVQGGTIFADLISSNKVPITTLTKCMRSDRKEILDLAQSVLQGDGENMINIDLGFNQKDVNIIYEKLWNHVKKQNLEGFRILSTLRKGPLGVDALNALLYDKFSKTEDRFPIMITRNAPQMDLYNGDTGILVKDSHAIFLGKEPISLSELPPFEYAYCISVHKSQGSEYDHVLFLVPDGSEAFGREVLYTAITRAKSKLEIDGNSEEIKKALKQTATKVSGIKDCL